MGRSIARWLSSNGAQNIVLTSRSATVNPQLQVLIDEAATRRTRILVKKCDVSDKKHLEQLVGQDLKGFPPIRGVIHAAMVLRDTLFEQMTVEEFKAVYTCKVDGALNLHSVLSNSPLDFFICLSSVAGIIGNRGQAAYSAANVFLDEFMRYRVDQGLPGVSIDLAAVSDVGYIADTSEERRREILRNVGDQTLSENEVLALLAAAVSGKINELCQGQCITGIHTSDPSAFYLSDGKFDVLREAIEAAAAGGESLDAPSKEIPLLKVLKNPTTTKDEASELLYSALATKIAAIIDLPADAIEPTLTLKKLGLDSLTAIEIRNWISRETEASVQVLELLSSGGIMGLVSLIFVKMGIFQ